MRLFVNSSGTLQLYSWRPSRGLGNRCSVLLSYRGGAGFPRFLRVSGQPRTRERRGTLRFVLAQESAHFVRESFLPSPATDGGQHGPGEL